MKSPLPSYSREGAAQVTSPNPMHRRELYFRRVNFFKPKRQDYYWGCNSPRGYSPLCFSDFFHFLGDFWEFWPFWGQKQCNIVATIGMQAIEEN